MEATLVVKRTFLEFDVRASDDLPRRERALSEGTIPLTANKDSGSRSSASKDDDSRSSASTMEETDSSLGSSEDGYLSFDESEMSLEEQSPTLEKQQVPMSCGKQGPPGRWCEVQQPVCAPSVTWVLLPMGPGQGSSAMAAAPARLSHNGRKKTKTQRQKDSKGVDIAQRTTIIVRGLSPDFSQMALQGMLDAAGFQGHYDFIYLPRNFKTSAALGYAIVNFVTPADAQEAIVRFSQQNTSYSDSHQGGLMMLIQRYRDSAMMHSDVPNEYKPVVFVGGQRVAFPPPSTAISAVESEKIMKALREQRPEEI